MNSKPRAFDLEDRLIEFSSLIIDVIESLPESTTGNHTADNCYVPVQQLLRFMEKQRAQSQEGISSTS
jgi:hypothetical protein